MQCSSKRISGFSRRPISGRIAGRWSGPTTFPLAVVRNASATSVTIGPALSVANAIRCLRPSTMVGSSVADVRASRSMSKNTTHNRGPASPKQPTVLVLDCTAHSQNPPPSSLRLLAVIAAPDLAPFLQVPLPACWRERLGYEICGDADMKTHGPFTLHPNKAGAEPHMY